MTSFTSPITVHAPKMQLTNNSLQFRLITPLLPINLITDFNTLKYY